jgi:hypothetical protein
MIHDEVIRILIALSVAHIVGDFVLQTKSDAERKNEPPVLVKHAVLVALTSYVFAGIWSAWLIPVAVFLSHAIVDPVKLMFTRRVNNTVRNRVSLFIGDQIIHIAVIIIVAMAVADTTAGMHMMWAGFFGNAYFTALILAGGAVLTTKVGGILIGMIVQPYLDQIESDGKHGSPNRRGLTEGGMVIGYLERFLIYIFILTGFPLGIGFLITAKSVFRFGEVSNPANRMEAEYIIIGTLMSFAYAVTVGYGVVAVLRVL